MKRINLILILLIISTYMFAQGCLPEGITFTTQAQIDNFPLDYPDCSEIEGDLKIQGYNITNFDSLSVLTSISGYLKVVDCDNLVNFSGLDNLQKIEGYFQIGDFYMDQYYEPHYLGNPSLVNLQGLNNLDTLGGGIRFYCNNSLYDLTGLESLKVINGSITFGMDEWWPATGSPSLQSLDGLDSLNYILGNLTIYDCDSLKDISALYNVIHIGQSITLFSNEVLTNISGLNNLNAESINEIDIRYNLNLSTCEIQSICDYIALPNASISIAENAPGCNSVQEVEEACLTKTNEITTVTNEIRINPNPAYNRIHIVCTKSIQIKKVTVYTQTGQKALTIKSPNKTIDISNLQPGLYFAEIKTSEGEVMRKVVVQ